MISSNPQKSPTKRKVINIIFLFTIFMAAVIYLVILPSIKSIRDLRTKIINEKINTEKKYQTEKNAIELRKKINKIESNLNDLENVFINKNKELEFITTLENIASNNSITQKISLSPPSAPAITAKNSKTKTTASTSKENPAQSSPLSISISGNYKNIINYLLELHSLKYYINIEGLDFSKTENNNTYPENNTSSNQIISLNITAKTYWK